MKNSLTIASVLLIGSWCVINAQQEPPSLKPSMSAPRPEGPPPLLLEVVANPERPPAYSNVNGPTELGKWLSISNFVRVPGSTMSSPPIRWVKLEPQFNGETVAVRVTLLRGVKGVEQEDVVGIYRLGIGEAKTLNDLLKVGIEPFKITLLDTVPPLPAPPTFVNDTKSIEIVSVRSENIPNPAYILTLRNLSDKNIRAIGLDMTFEGRPGPTALFQEEDGHPVISAGGVVEQYVRALMPKRTATGFVPSAASSTTIHIRGAVFSDLSYEGSVQDACFVESAVMGRKAYLIQVISLLDRQLEETFTDHIEAARQFKAKFEALSYDVGDAAKASSVSPACQDIAQRALNMANGTKLMMLRDLDQIIYSRPLRSFSFRDWMKTRRETYKTWLARL